MRSCASIVLVFLGSVCSAVAMGGGRPLSSFDELFSMTVQDTSWWMLLMADLLLVLQSGSSARYCWLLGLFDRSEIVVDPAGHLAECGRADGRDVVVDGMLWRTGSSRAS